MERDGRSEVLARLVKRIQYQWLCEKMKEEGYCSYLTLYNHEGYCWIHEGIVEKSSSVVMEVTLDRVVEADVESKQLLRVNG